MTDEVWDAGVREFWDHAHSRGSTTRLGNTKAHQYTDYFSKAGPFAEDLLNADSVLDIGPGFGDYLRSATDKDRHAIDVSKVSRERVEGMGVTAYAPGEIGEEVVDLVTCLSVVQHCNLEAVELLFADAFRALRPKGHFYLNGVHGGHSSSDPRKLLSAGRCSHSLDDVRELAELQGFQVVATHAYSLGSTGVWILYLAKP